MRAGSCSRRRPGHPRGGDTRDPGCGCASGPSRRLPGTSQWFRGLAAATAILAAALALPTTPRTQAADSPADTSQGDAASESGTTPPARAPLVLAARLADAIGPASAHFLLQALDSARDRGAEALLVELDTPGGLDESMRDLVQGILAAEVPVIVYVAPQGARAASAGLYVLLAAHVAAMAPGTNTGAAHPVNLGGGDVDEHMAAKIENDAASFVRSIAAKRGRNVEWAEKAVRESASITAEEALELGVIDLVAPHRQALLEACDGRSVELLTATRPLRTRDARVEILEMGWRDRLLSTIANPNVAYLLLMLGTTGIMMELWNPGAIFPGVAGAISLLLAFFALQVMPVNSVGLLLLLLGIILLVLEIKITSFGLLTLGGVTSLTLGTIFLFESADAFYRVSWSVLVPAVAGTTLFFLFVVGKGLRAQQRRPVTGAPGMIGEKGTADSDLAPRGRVFVHGEYWHARVAGGPGEDGAPPHIAAGERVEVVDVEGRELVVRPCPQTPDGR